MRTVRINENDYMFRKFDGIYIALFFHDGNSIMFDDVGTVFIDAIMEHPDCDDALAYAMDCFDNPEQQDISADFDDFLNRLLELNVIEITD